MHTFVAGIQGGSVVKQIDVCTHTVIDVWSVSGGQTVSQGHDQSAKSRSDGQSEVHKYLVRNMQSGSQSVRG